MKVRARFHLTRSTQSDCSSRGLGICFAGALLLLASGCAVRDDGTVDYRKGEIAAGAGTSAIGPDFARDFVLAPGAGPMQRVPGLNLQGEPLRLVPLVRKSASSNAPEVAFTDLDAVSIRLQAAHIEFYTEGPFSYLGDLIAEGQVHSRGEIAIVVNAFQLGEDGADFDFTKEGANEGRVVYYSQDVMADQPLNFYNLPVYGPATYEAKPIGIDFAVIELDLTDQVTMDLLTTLMDLGGKAFPAAAPGLAILNSLGSTLMQQQTNDVNARFQMLFDAPEGGYPDIPRTTLEVGSYVFLRLQDRGDDVDWGRPAAGREHRAALSKELRLCSARRWLDPARHDRRRQLH